MTCPACGKEMRLVEAGQGYEHNRCEQPGCGYEVIDEYGVWPLTSTQWQVLSARVRRAQERVRS